MIIAEIMNIGVFEAIVTLTAIPFPIFPLDVEE
jgi:hypothetical protein